MTTALTTPTTTKIAHRSGMELTPLEYPTPAAHPALVYLAGLAPGSRRAMRNALNVIAEIASGGMCDHITMPWHKLRYEHAAAIRARLAERYSHRSVNQQLSALRQVLKQCWRLGYVDAEAYQRAADVANVKGATPAQAETGRALSMGEFMALVGVCNDGTQAGIRDAAILGVGYACGLRRAEIAGIGRGDYDAQAGTLTIRGKGNKTRVVPIANGARAALDDWLAVRGDAPGPVFVRIRKGDMLTEAGLSDQAIYTILQSRAAAAGVKEFSPHDLRRTYAGDLLDAGADIVTVQKLMGHSNTATTAGYDRRDSKAKQAAAAKLHFPYVGRV